MSDTDEFTKCENGHLYDPKESEVCPYCPNSAAQSSGDQQIRDFSPRRPSQQTVAEIPTPNPSHQQRTMVETSPELGAEKTGDGMPPRDQVQRTVVEIPTPPLSGDRTTRVITAQEASEDAMPIFAWLVVLQGKQQYEVFRIDQEQTYLGGAVESGITIEDKYVSAEHASIRHRDGKFFITDLDSCNGTYINNFDPEAAIDRVELHDGDAIQIGQVFMKFKCL